MRGLRPHPTARTDSAKRTPARKRLRWGVVACVCCSLGSSACDETGAAAELRSRNAPEPRPRTALPSPNTGSTVVAASITVPERAPATANRHRSENPNAAETDAPRVYSKTRFVWIREKPSWSAPWLGYLWIGSSVPLASTQPIYARGCERWYAVQPRGYVCVDEKRATLDTDDPEYRAVAAHAPDATSTLPHRYAESLGAPRYETLPTRKEQRAREPDFDTHAAFIESARSGAPPDPTIAGVDLTPARQDAVAFSSLPPYVQVERLFLRRDSTVAYSDEYRYDDRTWLLTGDLAWVPKDRVRPYEPSAFHGVRVTDPRVRIAFFREHDRPAFERVASGTFVRAGRDFPRLGSTELTGVEETDQDGTYLETRGGLWVRGADAVVPTPAERAPWGALVGGPDTGKDRPGGRATWIETSIYGGWLIAYEGTTPVFTTLTSPGRGGAPQGTKDPVATASTPVGRFNVNGKFVTATMDAPDGVTHSDVPWVENFSGPHSIHAAYWHDAWGERASGGCLNVSPADAKWLFDFSDPPLPEGWYGVRWDPSASSTTVLMIHA